MQAIAGEQVAPVWAQPFLQDLAVLTRDNAELTRNYAELTRNMAILVKRSSASEIRRRNRYISVRDVSIIPPPNDTDDPPANFPRTILELTNLSGRDLTIIENFYSLSHAGDLTTRKCRICEEYGIPPSMR